MLTIAGERELALTADVADTFFEYFISFRLFDFSGKIFPQFSACAIAFVILKFKFICRGYARSLKGQGHVM